MSHEVSQFSSEQNDIALNSRCPCGNPQSSPIPHEHDQTEREKAIIKYFEKRCDDLLETSNADLLEACKKIISIKNRIYGFNVGSVIKQVEVAIAKAKKK